jgi:hypothetical protein
MFRRSQAPATWYILRADELEGSKHGVLGVKRAVAKVVGIDLGGARGKTTAVCELSAASGQALVARASTRSFASSEPWVDSTLWEYLATLGDNAAIAVNAPLTAPACVRCLVPVCPGVASCVDPAVIWLRSEGERLAERAASEEAAGAGHSVAPAARPKLRLHPYLHRATEVVLTYEREIWPTAWLGGGQGPVAARAAHFRRRLAACGIVLGKNLIEVSPRATLTALLGRGARGYKRDADAWQTRAKVLDQLPDLGFSPSSRLAREETLRNDHVFEAVIAAYTGFLWARDGWETPAASGEVWLDDGWIHTPPQSRR